MCLIFILISSVDFDMLMSIIEYKHSYLNIIVAVFCAKIVVDFGFESVIIDCLYSGTFLIEQLKKYDIFDIKINKLSTVLIQFREASLINFTKYRSK